MNIDEYRAIKAQEEVEKKEESKENKETKTNEEKMEEIENKKEDKKEPTGENKIDENKEEPTVEIKLPEKVKIDGIGEVPFDELTNGYLRQSDYTRKAQKLAKQTKEAQEAIELYNQLKNNPQIAEELKKVAKLPPSVDPTTAKVVELETRLYDMMLQNEVNKLQSKYPDFEVREVLQLAYDKKMTNLEDAYLLHKATNAPKQESVDVEKIKEQLRKEIMKELDSKKDTSSIISTNDQSNPVKEVEAPKITRAEEEVAKKMFRKEKNPIAEYIKWRDKGKRGKRKG